MFHSIIFSLEGIVGDWDIGGVIKSSSKASNRYISDRYVDQKMSEENEIIRHSRF